MDGSCVCVTSVDNYKAHIEVLCADGQKITKAWFTTFNLNLDFFERYLLHPLAGFEQPRNALDYENLQAALLAGDFGKDVDVHCFCDQQVFDASQPKRTSLPVHLVTPATLGRQHAIFHPKVIYLENSAGDAVLGAGSANLTVDGWAHNHEVFAFEKVVSAQQRDSITTFFSKIAASCQLDTGTFVSGAKPKPEKSSDWVFFHSFSHAEPFLTHLLRDSGSDLWVLSPYFSTDLGNLLTSIKQEGVKRVHVIPDLKSDGSIRTTYSDAIQQCLQNKFLCFYALPDALRREGVQGEDAMRHAKLWMTDTRLAIGSWNMTRPGTGTAGAYENNVEAGFIYQLSSPYPFDANPLELNESLFMQAAALKAEAPVAADRPIFPYQVHVIFDWNQHGYRVSVQALHDRDIPPANAFSLLLPDIKEPQPLESGKQILLLRSARELCRQRMFVIKDDKGMVCHTGLILEEHLEHRRGQGFANIYDLLAAMLSGDPTNHGNGRMAVADIHRIGQPDEGNDDESPADLTGTGSIQLGYFSLFRLFASYHDQINKLTTQDSNENTWKRLMWSQPGSVMELSEKLKTLFEEDAAYSDVFRWFAAQEMLFLLESLKTHCQEWDVERVEADLCLPVPSLGQEESQSNARRQYLEYITTEIRQSTPEEHKP